MAELSQEGTAWACTPHLCSLHGLLFPLTTAILLGQTPSLPVKQLLIAATDCSILTGLPSYGLGFFFSSFFNHACRALISRFLRHLTGLDFRGWWVYLHL